MNEYVVYHRKELAQDIDLTTYDGLKRLGWPRAFQAAAYVDADSAAIAYGKTQHIDTEWWKNDGVRRVGDGTRSTSVGDVILTPSKHLIVVVDMGFEDLSEIMAGRILDDAEQYLEARTVADERAALGEWPTPQTISDYLFWIEDETQVQTDRIRSIAIEERKSQEAYARALAGVAIELRGWGFEPSLPPWAKYVIINESCGIDCLGRDGEHYVMPGEDPHTYGSLEDAAEGLQTMIDEYDHTPQSAPIYRLVAIPPAKVYAALAHVQAEESSDE